MTIEVHRPSRTLIDDVMGPVAKAEHGKTRTAIGVFASVEIHKFDLV